MATRAETSVVYAAGIVQGMQLDMADLGASTTAASLALTAFWAMVTLGRILFAAIQRWVGQEWSFAVAGRRPSPTSLHPRLGHSR